MKLSSAEQRVLGSLIEKEISTPENYPLSLNGLQAAANQLSSRDPVMKLGEDELRQALHQLEERDLVRSVHDARVVKWEHQARSHFQLRRDEIAVLCLLLLRGPQTPGELRSRADRLYSFTDLDSVAGTLERLAGSAPTPETNDPRAGADPAIRPLVKILPRQPGAREARYAHLLGGDIDTAREPAPQPFSVPGTAPTGASTGQSPFAVLESRLRELEARVARLEVAQSAAHNPQTAS